MITHKNKNNYNMCAESRDDFAKHTSEATQYIRSYSVAQCHLYMLVNGEMTWCYIVGMTRAWAHEVSGYDNWGWSVSGVFT